jgi:hypothetical protein
VGRDRLDAGVGEPDRVQHPAHELGDPGTAMAWARLGGDRFGDDAAQRIEIDDAVNFPPETGRAGGA